MKLFGSLSEIVSLIFRKNSQTITLRPNQATTYTAARDAQLPAQDADSILVSRTSTDTLTNKTLTSPAITTPTGIVKGDVGLGNVDNTSDTTKNSATATLTNKTIDGDDNTVQDLPETSLKTVLANASKFFTRNASGVPESTAKAVPTGAVVGTTDSQTLTSKTLTSPVITSPTGIVKADVGLGNVDNTSDATKLTASATLQNKTIDNTNSIIVKDSVFTIQDNIDITKQAQFQLSGNTTGTTRTYTPPNADAILVGTDTAQVLTNKDIDGGTASNSIRITIPKDTTTNINALTRKAGTLLYDTSTSQFKGDNGSTLTAFAAGSVATSTATGTVTSFVPAILSANKTVSGANYTVLDNDGFENIEVTTGASDRTITLPTLSDNLGRTLRITKVDSGAGLVIIDGEGSEAISGALTNSLIQQTSFIQLYGGASEWKVVAVCDYIQSLVAATNISSAPKTIASVALTPGDWDLRGLLVFDASSTPSGVQFLKTSIVTTTNTDGTRPDTSNSIEYLGTFSITPIGVPAPPVRAKITANTTYFLTGNTQYSTGQLTAAAKLTARRIG